MAEIENQVIQAETELLDALRNGELMKGVGMHMNSPDYRNIWSGDLKTYDQLYSRISTAMDNGLRSIDYQVSGREIAILDESNAVSTLDAIETSHMENGETETSGRTFISILWRKIDGKWWVGYLHASEEPKQAAGSIWDEE